MKNTWFRTPQTWIVLLLFFITLFSIFTYTFLHEGGHALAGVLFGGKITEFNLNFLNLSAHVGITGDFNRPQRIVQNLAGVGLPFLAWLIFILAVPRRANLAVEFLKGVGSLIILNVFLVWILFPFLYLREAAPSDDATNFLVNSGANPYLVAGLFSLIIIGGWALYISKIDGLRNEIGLLKNPGQAWNLPAIRRSAAGIAVILILLSLAAFGLNGFRLPIQGKSQAIQPPPGYDLATRLSLSAAEHSAESVFRFEIDQSRTVGVFLLIEEIDSPYFEVKLAGPNSFLKQIIHAEGYRADLDGPTLEEQLQPGLYEVILTSRKSPGTLCIYTKGTGSP